MHTVDEDALKAATDATVFSDFIDSKKNFIIGCIFKTTKKYVSKSDDEWSVALIAFSDAIKTYSYNKGGFLPYAEKIIKNRLIDYYRSQQKYKSEFFVNPVVFDCEPSEDDEDAPIKIAVAEKIVLHEDNSIKYEIDAITSVFKEYGFSFYDLAKCSPKSKKTKEACKQAVLYILNNEKLISDIKTTKQLPINNIQKNTDLPRKLIETHRRYIIAAMEILSGEYPYLAEYVSYIRKGAK
ncbi:MAG: sigma factor [Eubacteriales bacterium]|nr:sigma factor [Eubacteriales bacterium]MDD4475888.1 sigma factor [Eubacteriales bacterium]